MRSFPLIVGALHIWVCLNERSQAMYKRLRLVQLKKTIPHNRGKFFILQSQFLSVPYGFPGEHLADKLVMPSRIDYRVV
jgi:hypothetical protein